MAGGATGCCCGGAKIGFDTSAPAMIGCFPGIPIMENVAANVSRISECKLVFAGLFNTCGNAMQFTVGQFDTIRQWIENGGRFYLSMEFRLEPFVLCLNDPDACNAFFSAMGSTLAYSGNVYDANCHTDADSRIMIPGAANIAQGLAPMKMAATGEIAGGTTVFLAPSGPAMMRDEKIGRGFIFACGDSNVTPGGFCSYNNCAFFQRLYNYEDAAII